MNNILFKIPNDITKQEVINKMNYFKEKSQEISEVFEDDVTNGRDLARELRKELELEYKNNNLIRTQKYYVNNIYFKTFKVAVRDSYVNVIGQLDKGRKTRSFLYDVQDYMTYYENDFKWFKGEKGHNFEIKSKSMNSSIIRPIHCPKYLVFFKFNILHTAE